MSDTTTVGPSELMGLAAALAEKAGTSTDASERAKLLKNVQFLLNLAGHTIVREISAK